MTAGVSTISRLHTGSALLAAAAVVAVSAGMLAAQDDDLFDARARQERLEREAAELEAEAAAHLAAARELFAEIGDLGAADEAADSRREELRTHLVRAHAKLFLLAEGYPDSEERAEDLLMEVDSLEFWVKRLSPVDLEEESPDGAAAETESPPAPVELTVETLPEGVRPPRFEDGAAALAAADDAEKRGERGEAFYDLLEVLQHHDEDSGAVAAARERVEQMRSEVTGEELLSHLRTEIRSEDPLVRVFAAREIAFLGLIRSVDPLITAMKDERDPAVYERILEAFRFTPKRATGKELAKLARSRDRKLMLAVIETLSGKVGGRHGARALVDFAQDDDEEIWRSAVMGISLIGGDAAARAYGEITRSSRSQPKLVHESFHALASLDTDAAAEQMTVHLAKKGRYLYAASDDLVSMGGEAAPALIRALSVSKLRSEANDCLKRISGQNMGASVEKWREWYLTWREQGESALPCYKRGAEPWNGGG